MMDPNEYSRVFNIREPAELELLKAEFEKEGTADADADLEFYMKPIHDYGLLTENDKPVYVDYGLYDIHELTELTVQPDQMLTYCVCGDRVYSEHITWYTDKNGARYVKAEDLY